MDVSRAVQVDGARSISAFACSLLDRYSQVRRVRIDISQGMDRDEMIQAIASARQHGCRAWVGRGFLVISARNAGDTWEERR